MSVTTCIIDIFDSNLNLLAEIDSVSNAHFKRSWYDIGDFSIQLNANDINTDPLRNAEILAYLQRATTTTSSMQAFCFPIVMFNKDPYKSGFITDVKKSINEDGKGGQIITITGFELKHMFSWRTVQQLNASYHYYLTGTTETVMKTLIQDQCGSSCTDANRRFSLLTVATDSGRGTSPTAVLDTKYTLVSDNLKTLSLGSYLGWYCYLDLTNKKIIMDCSLGLDRTESQSVNTWAVFSPDFDTLKRADIEDTDANYRNLVYVGGNYAGSARTIAKGYSVSEPTDMSRREFFIDASQLTSSTDLANKGTLALAQYNQTLVLDGQGLVYSPLVLGTDYNLGDKVNLVAYSGDTPYSVLIIEVQESWQNADYQIDLTWGKPAPTITNQVQQIVNNLGLNNSNSEAGTNADTINQQAMLYTFANADIVQAAGEIIYNNINLSGTLASNKSFTFNFNNTTKDGSKYYNIKCNVSSTSSECTLTLKTAIGSSATVAIPIIISTDTLVSNPIQFRAYVDQSGNVTSDYWTVLAFNASTGYYVQDSTGNGASKKWLFGTSAYDEVNNRLGIGTTSPANAKVVINAAAEDAIEMQSTSNDNWRIGPNTGAGAGFGIYDGTATQTRLKIDLSGNVGIGTTSPATSALLDLTSTTGALLVSRMNTAAENALTPVNGMIIYNSQTAKFRGYENGAWANLI